MKTSHLFYICLITCFVGTPVHGNEIAASQATDVKAADSKDKKKKRKFDQDKKQHKRNIEKKKNNKKKNNTKKKFRNRSQQEELALQFVKSHSPEVAKLLQKLKKDKTKKQYNRAMKELISNYNRLERFKKRDSKRYELESKLWVVNSNIKLIIAKAATNPDMKFEDKLEKAVIQRIKIRTQLLSLNLETTRKRMQRLEHRLKMVKGNEQRHIRSQTKMLTATVEKTRRRKASAKSKGHKKIKTTKKGKS